MIFIQLKIYTAFKVLNICVLTTLHILRFNLGIWKLSIFLMHTISKLWVGLYKNILSPPLIYLSPVLHFLNLRWSLTCFRWSRRSMGPDCCEPGAFGDVRGACSAWLRVLQEKQDPTLPGEPKWPQNIHPKQLRCRFWPRECILKKHPLSQPSCRNLLACRSHLWTFYLPTVLITRFKAPNSVVPYANTLSSVIISASARGVSIAAAKPFKGPFLIKRLSRAECGGPLKRIMCQVQSAFSNLTSRMISLIITKQHGGSGVWTTLSQLSASDFSLGGAPCFALEIFINQTPYPVQ